MADHFFGTDSAPDLTTLDAFRCAGAGRLPPQSSASSWNSQWHWFMGTSSHETGVTVPKTYLRIL